MPIPSTAAQTLASSAADCAFERPRQADIVSDISYQDFVEHYVKTRTPVVVRGALKHLPAAQWTMESFRQQWGDKVFELEDRQYTLTELIDLNLASSPELPAPYLRSVDVESEFPELMPDLAGGVKYAWPNYRFMSIALRHWYFNFGGHFTEFFLGGEGNAFPFLHADHPPINTFIGLFYGEKEWIMFEPEQADKLYITDSGFVDSHIEDIFAPDFDKYPDLMQANPLRFVQQAGDLIYMPCHWIHTVRNLGPTLSVGWDQLAASSWASWRADFYRNIASRNRPKAAMVNAYLACLGPALKTGERLIARFCDDDLNGRIV